MATALRQVPSAVDQILLTDVWELFDHWTQWPPEFVLLRKLAKYEPPEPEQKVNAKSAAGLASVFGAAQKAPSHVKEMVRWAEEMKQQYEASLVES